MRRDIWFDSSGAGMIHACRWEPAQNPVAVFQIVHGLADHAERYDDFANFLTKLGYLVVAEDHMGHGRSFSPENVRGYFHGGWFCAVEDSYRLLVMTKEEFPKIPYVLFGHSMGSYMAQTILQKYPHSEISGCILCATGWQPEIFLTVGGRISQKACDYFGETKPSPKLQTLVSKMYNRRVEHPLTMYDWVNRNGREVERCLTDPLCSFDITAGLMRDLLIGISYIQEPENLNKMDKFLPVLFVAGGDDPVGSYADGVRKTAEVFTDIGLHSVTVRIYPLCRHEILNEINKGEVYGDIAEWLTVVTRNY